MELEFPRIALLAGRRGGRYVHRPDRRRCRRGRRGVETAAAGAVADCPGAGVKSAVR